MKKLLALGVILTLSTSMSMAASNYGSALKNAIKQDIQNSKQEIKADIDAKAKANMAASEAKKAEKIKQIDAKLDTLNKELKEVKSSKTMTNTEKTIRMNSLNRQIEYYNKQKAALK